MRLEEQVCSLELSKKLKELGVRQETLDIVATVISQEAADLVRAKMDGVSDGNVG